MKLPLMLSTAMGLALSAGGALAQDSPYTHMSTPQERVQTDALNQSQLEQSGNQVADNSAEPSQTYLSGSDNDTSGATAPPNQLAALDDQDSQSQYQSNLDRYQDQRAQYEDQKAQYQDDRDAYRGQQDAYNDTYGDSDDAAYPPANAYADNDRDEWGDISAPTALDEISGVPRDRLIGMEVERENGHIVGRIQELDMRRDGRIASVQIALPNGSLAWVRGGALSYDPSQDAVVTDLTMAELNSLAGSG